MAGAPGPPNQPGNVPAAILDAAFDIVAEHGFAKLSVRRLGAALHYSPSAIAHYVTPMGRFASVLWVELHDRVAVRITAAALEAHPPIDGSDDWTSHAAAAWLDWSRAYPRLARFYVEFMPNPDDVRLHRDHCGVAADDWARSGEQLANAWWFFVRRSQAALELAIRTPRSAEPVDVLARELSRIAAAWHVELAGLLVRAD